MVDTCTCIHTFMRACINTSSTCMHTYTHKCTVMQICSTYSSELSVRVFLNTYDAQCLWSRPMSVCVCLVADPQAGISRDQRPKDEYIYGEKNIHGHIWPSCACFRLPLPTSFRLSLPRLGQETSDVAEIDNPGAEKAGKVLLVFFPVVFLENAFLQVCA